MSSGVRHQGGQDALGRSKRKLGFVRFSLPPRACRGDLQFFLATEIQSALATRAQATVVFCSSAKVLPTSQEAHHGAGLGEAVRDCRKCGCVLAAARSSQTLC